MSLLKTIVENKEWVFSGIGVSTLGLILYVIKHILTRRTPPQLKPASQSPPLPKKIVQVTPSEIVERLENVPDLQKDDIFKSFVGLHVQWEGVLVGASMCGYTSRCNHAQIQLGYPTKVKFLYKAYIFTSVDLELHPELKVMQTGTIIRLTGDIESRSSANNIHLGDCTVQILEPKTAT